MIIMKFGGTSVQDATSIQKVYEIVQQRRTRLNSPVLVVVSAMAKVTDSLVEISSRLIASDLSGAQKLMLGIRNRHLEAGKELDLPTESLSKVLSCIDEIQSLLPALSIIGEVSPRSRDRILAMGELASSLLVSGYFNSRGGGTEEIGNWLDSRSLIKTDSNHGCASVDFIRTQQCIDALFAKPSGREGILVCGGFIGSDSANHTTTLGRGGSDYSASILGAAVDARQIEIWTDVDGVLTTDPRLVPSAKRILQMGFEEASELAYFGAKVLHPATIFPAVKKKIPVLVLNSKNPASTGTVIKYESIQDANVVKAIAFKRKITMVNIHSTRMLGASGFLKSISDIFAQRNISVDLISTSEVSVSMTLDPSYTAESLKDAILEIEQFASISVLKDKSSVSTVGAGIRHSSGVAARIFQAIREFNVSMISMGASEVNVSIVVEDQDLPKVVEQLHREFFSGPLNPEIFAVER